MGNKFTFILITQYIILSVMYGFEGNWAKAGYWLGATIIACSVLVMK